MKNNCKLSIILPVYNEKESLSIMIKILEATLDFPNEILVVYDDKTDNSIDAARDMQKLFSNIKLVHNDLGQGVQNAVKKGIVTSVSDIFLITAVDEIFPIMAIKEMLELIEEQGCDFVSGTRYALGGKRLGGSFVGGLLSRVANRVFRLITGLVLTDATTGIKMIRKSAMERLTVESNPVGWAFAFELSIKAQLEGMKLGEIPLISVDRLFGGNSTFKLGSWSKEYLRWFWWGIGKISRLNRTQKSVVTLQKYLNS